MAYMVRMREVDLRRVDLNLLVALEALLDEKNVTRAAHRLGMSQPAASRALGRLRALFSDALLVDGPGGYVLSSRAEEVRPALRRILAGVGEMLEANAFDPATATGRIRLLMPDLQAAVLAPHLLARLAGEAPSLDLDIAAQGTNGFEALEHGAADAMVALIDEAPAGIHRRRLYDEELVTLMRAQHPALAGKLTLDRFLALEHIVVSVTGVGPAPVDEVLARMGRTRRVKLRVPNFFAAVEIAARSDLIMTLPSSLARAAANMRRFVSLPPPLDIGSFAMSLAWHARQQDAPRHIWLRRAIVSAATDMSSMIEVGS
ncbi:LysR family transcriptional regulator [Rhizobium azibense]|uniref:LysR family transcriptional regulator n=2 Tax=Rhizobium TaxID=379 RepID=A0A4R3QR11_9HYPH|nr:MULTISPECIES: LysR family transcriptional regulator [Rhizobium]TCU23784.1 LysR family transcriptional regulator [Rhizobium azibense]TCU36054.1 LysR family transcriptional regulator [Rhizobium azibense]